MYKSCGVVMKEVNNFAEVERKAKRKEKIRLREGIKMKKGLDFQENEEHDRSIAIFDKVIKRNPKNAHAYYLRGRSKWLKWLKGDCLTDELDALHDLEKADELGSKSARCIIREIQEHNESLFRELVGWSKDQESEKVMG